MERNVKPLIIILSLLYLFEIVTSAAIVHANRHRIEGKRLKRSQQNDFIPFDSAAMAEAKQTKQPVIIRDTDSMGRNRTTTYKVDEQGQLTRSTVIEYTRRILDDKMNKDLPQTIRDGRQSQPNEAWEMIRPSTTINPEDNFYMNYGKDPSKTMSGHPSIGYASNPFRDNVVTNYNPFTSGLSSDFVNAHFVTNIPESKSTFSTHPYGILPIPLPHTTNTTTQPDQPFLSLEEFLRPATETVSQSSKNKTHPIVHEVSTLPPPKQTLYEIMEEQKLRELKEAEEDLRRTIIRERVLTQLKPIQPTMDDFILQTRNILEKADIKPEEILSANNSSIVKTRTEPDGRTITTTYRIHTIPNGSTTHHISSTNSGRVIPIENRSPSSNPLFSSRVSPFPNDSSRRINNADSVLNNQVDTYLQRLGLTAQQLLDQKGEYIKTIVDKDGRVLTVNLVLSTIKGIPAEDENFVAKPIK